MRASMAYKKKAMRVWHGDLLVFHTFCIDMDHLVLQSKFICPCLLYILYVYITLRGGGLGVIFIG